MGTRIFRQLSTVVVLSAIIVGLVILYLFDQVGGLKDADQTTPISTYTPAIPESTDTAKEYIDHASAQANKGDYDAALSILDEGLKKFPDDANLKLTKEFYENEAQRHAR